LKETRANWSNELIIFYVNGGKGLNSLNELIAVSEDWLIRCVLNYAKRHNYIKYTSTLEEAWRISIAGLSKAMLSALESGQKMDLGPDVDYIRDSASAFGILEVMRHRERRVSLAMFLGLMKLYRRSYIELVKNTYWIPDRMDKACQFINCFFDRVEIAFCNEWAEEKKNTLIDDFQFANLRMTVEKALVETNHKLSEMNSELETLSKYKSEFLANMGHELRTPLTAIIAFSGELMVHQTGPLNERQADYVHEIMDSGEQLLRLINDLLDLSKIESGKMPVNFTEVNIGEVVEDVEKMLRPLSRQKKIKVKIETSQSLEVVADALKVRQVVQNLLDNAIKFGPQDSTVYLSAFPTIVPSRGVTLMVRDSGPGIPVGDQEMVFDAFFQVSKGTNKEYKGTGLGLTLVKKIVELHKGEIKLDSQENDGTSVEIFWPAVPLLDK
jgi:signal transduction histidine kinase